jgi:uncharacterized protein
MRKRIGTQKIIAYILILAFASPLLMLGFQKCSSNNQASEAKQIMEEYNQQKPINSQTASSFYKEGTLDFLTADGKTIKKIDLELAKTDEKRSQGLMYRQNLGEAEGMLFVFDKLEPQSFWMRNTLISLDIIYVDDKKEIVSIAKMAQPKSEDPIPSGVPAIYVVEVNGGFCDRYQIKVGDKVQWAENNL